MVRVRKEMPKIKKEAPKKAKLNQFLNKKAEGRQNTFVFKGFYDKMSLISGKIGHNTNQKYGFLGDEQATRYLMGFGDYESDDENKIALNSNFIAMVRSAPKSHLAISDDPYFAVNIMEYVTR
jgi:hypothetical protein